MTRLFVLLEGAADVPAVREILRRRFGLHEGERLRLIPHQGRGELPRDPLSPPPPHQRGLLHQLPSKLRAYASLPRTDCVVVLVDADDTPCTRLLQALDDMLRRLPRRPARVLFRIAIEETESWFIADEQAVLSAYPRARTGRLRRIPPDAIVGAWERLAEALGVPPRDAGAAKVRWAERISPHLDLEAPRSPSLRKFLQGIERVLAAPAAAP